MSFGYKISPLLWVTSLHFKGIREQLTNHMHLRDFNTFDSILQNTLNDIQDPMESTFLG